MVRRGYKRFCKHGHDTSLCGRRADNYFCNTCALIKNRIDPSKDQRYKQFCSHGHEKLIVGVTKSGHCRECRKEYYLKHKSKIIKRQSRYWARRILTDITYKLSHELRKRIRLAVKDGTKRGSAVRDLGCSIDFLKQYISSQFNSKMSWANWGTVWELDHVKPLFKFDLTDFVQFRQAAHYTNLQPLSIADHRLKTNTEMKEYWDFHNK